MFSFWISFIFPLLIIVFGIVFGITLARGSNNWYEQHLYDKSHKFRRKQLFFSFGVIPTNSCACGNLKEDKIHK